MVQPPVPSGATDRDQTPRPRKGGEPFELVGRRLNVFRRISDGEGQLEQIRRGARILWIGDLEIEVPDLVSRVADVHELGAAAGLSADVTGDRHAAVADAKYEIGPRRVDQRPGLASDDGQSASEKAEVPKRVVSNSFVFERPAKSVDERMELVIVAS